MSLSAYLAANYLTADPPDPSTSKTSKSKRRKRTHPKEPATANISIVDDADDSLLLIHKNPANSDDDDAPTTVLSNATAKRKKGGWKTVGAPAPSSREQAAADAIIAGVEAERREEGRGDEGPAVVGDDGGATVEARAQAKGRRKNNHKGEEQQQETIYRDATGRVINVAMARAEARRKVAEAERKELEKKEELRGDVQRKAADERRKELGEAKYLTVARGVDDLELNEELKAKERWNDPMAGLLAEKRERSGGEGGAGKQAYKGPAEPNRYGIRPGHRWDGVDRGSGFEKEWFAARNRRQNVMELEYAWQMDE